MQKIIKELAKISFADAIALRALDRPETNGFAKLAFRRMHDACHRAVKAFPCTMTVVEVDEVQEKIEAFLVRTGWEVNAQHTQTYLFFSMRQLEGLRESLHYVSGKHEKRTAIKKILEAEMSLYGHYSADREYRLCEDAGLHAAEAWEAIWK